MKKTILSIVLSLLTSFSIFGQNPLEYSRVVKIDSVSAGELFSRAKIWIALTYKSAQDVIQLSENNHIIIKAKFSPENTKLNFMTFSVNDVDYCLEIETRDGRFRAAMHTITLCSRINQQPKSLEFGILQNEEVPYDFPGYATMKQCQMIVDDVKKQCETHFEMLVSLLSENIRKEKVSAKEDW